MKYITRVHSYEAYGLNRHRNFLHPETFLCDDIFSFAVEVLHEHECSNSAVFIHTMTVGLYVVHMYDQYDEEDDEFYQDFQVYNYEHESPDYFAMFDANNRLCCYSLIVETSDGKWKIIE